MTSLPAVRCADSVRGPDATRVQRTAPWLALAAALTPPALLAGTDWFAVPSLAIAQRYDDNLFSSATQPEDDRVTQATPGVEAGARSSRSELRARYSLDDETYAEHSELDSDRARERAGLDLRYEADRTTTVTAQGAYTRTQRPGELNPDVGVESARGSAEGLSLGSSLANRPDAVTLRTVGYTYGQERLAGRPGSDTHAWTLESDQGVSRTDTLLLGYSYRRFLFDGQGDVDAHSLSAGVTREFSQRTSATVKGGPRYSQGSVDPEVSLSMRHRFDPGSLSLAYGRGLSTAIGEAGTVKTETLEAILLRPIGRDFELRATAAWLSSERADRRAQVGRMALEASYRVNEPLFVFASWQGSAQHGSLDDTGAAEIDRNVLMLGFVLTVPPRPAEPPAGVDREQPDEEERPPSPIEATPL